MEDEKLAKLSGDQITLRETRQRAEVSRQDLATYLGVHNRTIVRWERHPGGLSLKNFHRAIQGVEAIHARRLAHSAEDIPELSKVSMLALARELTRRLENIEATRRIMDPSPDEG